MGAKKKPFYRVVVANSRNARNGAYIENVGTYDPLLEKDNVNLKEEAIISWLEKGAQPTKTVRDLLRKSGIWKRFSQKTATAKEE